MGASVELLGLRKILGIQNYESPEDKMRRKIKEIYGVKIQDKGIIQQFLSLAQQSYMGDYDRAIHSDQGMEMVRQYAEMTDQTPKSMRDKMTSATLMERGGSLYQQANYSNGMPIPFSGSLPGSSLDRIVSGGITVSVIMPNISVTVPDAKNLLTSGVMKAIADNPKIVQKANVQATKSSSNRRELASLQWAPGTLTS
jgi:hypothetical protein